MAKDSDFFLIQDPNKNKITIEVQSVRFSRVEGTFEEIVF